VTNLAAEWVPVSPPNGEVVALCRDLLKINTSNPTQGERVAAEYVAAALAEVGIESEWFEPAPQRTSIVARLPGRDPSLPPLLLHAHLDVVPAIPEDWSVDPFSGVIKDGYVWGRGAVDMKGMVAAMVAVARSFRRDGARPRRDIVLAFFADEEAGGELGAGYVTRTRPDLFAGCEDAIGEVGGFSHRISADQRCYLVSNAEKGVLWARLQAGGRAGHGSMINDDNAVGAICEAVARVADHHFASEPTATVTMFLEKMADLLGLAGEPAEVLLDKLGPLARMIQASMQDTLNPTSVDGGYKVNVIPGKASATVDGRFLPGHESGFGQALAELAGDKVQVETIFSGAAVESPWDVPLIDAIQRALQREDNTATVLPYMGTAFTDAKWISKLGIRCYGFCPLLLPDDLDVTALFHGVDERVPVSALQFSVAVLRNLLEEY
jgi:acetylornithine deacetylase/succinyl-diaminopimelate desuccinylase-like protein